VLIDPAGRLCINSALSAKLISRRVLEVPLIGAMPSCIERQRLVDEYEAALDEFLNSLRRSLGDRSDSFERHKALLRCRAALAAHCLDHGCHGKWPAANAAGD